MNYDEILKCYEGETELHANTSFEFGLMSYTKNEVALETLISNINNQFYYIGEEDDKVAPIDVKKFTEHCVAFIDSIEVEEDS